MTIRKILLAVMVMAIALNSSAQTNLTSYNKSLAFYNPAIQNLEYESFYASASYFTKPQTEGENYLNYLAHLEYKASEMFRLGFHSNTVNTRLSKLDLHKIYGSFKFEMDEGNFFQMGLEFGVMQDMTKLAEFNKVFSPTRYEFTDSISNTSDVGFGAAYASKQFTIGISLNRLNGPKLVPYPVQRWNLRTTPDTAFVKHDTTIILGEQDFVSSNVNANINAIYTYDATEDINITHSLLITNPTLESIDFIGLQNFIRFKEQLTIGLGIFDNNSSTGYMASLGYTIANKVSVEAAAFFLEEFNYDPNAENPEFTYTPGGTKIDAKGMYISSGLKPTIEGCLRFTF